MNNVVLIGRLTRNPEVTKRNEEGNPTVANFTLAVDRPKRQGEEQSADFIRIVVFGKTAATVDSYLAKGRQVAVLGRIQTGSYEKEGTKVYTTDVVADRVEFLGSPNGGQKGASGGPAEMENTPPVDAADEVATDVPF